MAGGLLKFFWMINKLQKCVASNHYLEAVACDDNIVSIASSPHNTAAPEDQQWMSDIPELC